MKPAPMHPAPPPLDLVDHGPFWIRVMDHDAGGKYGAGNVFEGWSTFTARPMPYRKAWGHRYHLIVDACPFLTDIVARVGPGKSHADYVAGADTIEAGERYYVELLDRTGPKDPVPTASELHAAVKDGLAQFGVTRIEFR